MASEDPPDIKCQSQGQLSAYSGSTENSRKAMQITVATAWVYTVVGCAHIIVPVTPTVAISTSPAQ